MQAAQGGAGLHQDEEKVLLRLLTSVVSSPSDRLRTTTNVLGDSLGAGIIEHLSRRELQCRDAEVIEDKEKAYQLISQENDVINHPNSETTM